MSASCLLNRRSMLNVSGLSLSFGGVKAVKDVSFSVYENEIVSVIGPNGAGKTSLFNAITGLYDLDKGRVEFDGVEVRKAITLTVIVRFLLVAILSGVFLHLLVNIQEIWGETIAKLYIYLTPFPWEEAALMGLQSFWTKPLWSLMLGFVVGGLGAWASWIRGRRSPSLVTSRGIARTFQNIRIIPKMSVLDNVVLAVDKGSWSPFWRAGLATVRHRRLESAVRVAAFEELKFVGLHDHADSLAAELPYGLQRRLEIARALALKPRLLLLDEPAAGLNTAESEQLMQLISQIKNQGISVILIEHHMKVVMKISDRVLVLDQGRLIAEGTPAEIKSNARVIEAYLGDDIDVQH